MRNWTRYYFALLMLIGGSLSALSQEKTLALRRLRTSEVLVFGILIPSVA